MSEGEREEGLGYGGLSWSGILNLTVSEKIAHREF